MNIVKLSDNVAVSGQIQPEDVAAIADAGYKVLINNRPDGEEPGQPANADIAAAHLASAIGARRLVYLCDVPGLLRDPKDPQTLISSVSENEVPMLRKDGVIGSGMLPKVESAVNAMSRGVHRVHLIDGRMPHSILLEIFTDKGVGTEIVHASK